MSKLFSPILSTGTVFKNFSTLRGKLYLTYLALEGESLSAVSSNYTASSSASRIWSLSCSTATVSACGGEGVFVALL